jgi:LruC domain-containing protein
MAPNIVYISTMSSDGYPTMINKDQYGYDSFKPIFRNLLDEVKILFPEGETIIDKHPDWLKKSDLHTIDNCTISLTFVDEGAGYKNGISYYVYDIDNPPTRFSDIPTLYVVLPNASKTGSGGSMNAGDTMQLAYRATGVQALAGKQFATSLDYTFPTNKGIAFVVHSNRWSPSQQKLRPSQMYSSDPVLNPETTAERRHHFVNVQSETTGHILYGMEDIHRDKSHCDHDFNDAIFFVTPIPIEAIDPCTYNSQTEQKFTGTFMCEDIIKENSDYDYDDFCGEYNVVETLTSEGRIAAISVGITALCRGASYDHEFGVIIPGVKSIPGAKVVRETHIGESGVSSITDLTNDILSSGSDRISLVDSTSTFLAHNSTWATNTIIGYNTIKPSYVTIKVLFTTPITRDQINDRYFPYNFYLSAKKGDRVRHDLFSDVSYGNVSGALAELGVTEKKKILLIEGVTDLRFPIEKKKLSTVYHKLKDFLAGDLRYQAWYLEKFAKTQLLYPKVAKLATPTYNDWLTTYPRHGDLFVMPVINGDVEQSLQDSRNTLTEWTGLPVDDTTSLLQVYGNLLVRHDGQVREVQLHTTDPTNTNITASNGQLDLLAQNNASFYLVNVSQPI